MKENLQQYLVAHDHDPIPTPTLTCVSCTGQVTSRPTEGETSDYGLTDGEEVAIMKIVILYVFPCSCRHSSRQAKKGPGQY